jgi:hypothetical protein
LPKSEKQAKHDSALLKIKSSKAKFERKRRRNDDKRVNVKPKTRRLV